MESAGCSGILLEKGPNRGLILRQPRPAQDNSTQPGQAPITRHQAEPRNCGPGGRRFESGRPPIRTGNQHLDLVRTAWNLADGQSEEIFPGCKTPANRGAGNGVGPHGSRWSSPVSCCLGKGCALLLTPGCGSELPAGRSAPPRPMQESCDARFLDRRPRLIDPSARATRLPPARSAR
jgi:hypothetical protein